MCQSPESGLIQTEVHPEQQLLQQIVRRDQKALHALYAKYAGMLRSQIMRIVRCPDTTADVLQDIFAQIWEKADVFDMKRGELVSWLSTIARNRAIDQVRRRQRHQTLSSSLTYFEELRGKHSHYGDDPHLQFCRAEHKHTLEKAMGTLPQAQCAILQSAFFEGHSQSEIAQQHQLPLGTVKTRMRQGLLGLERKLRSHLAEEGHRAI